MSRHTLFCPGKSKTFFSGSFNADLSNVNAENAGNFLSHFGDERLQPGSLGNDDRINIKDLEPLFV